MKKIIIIGAGGAGKEILWTIDEHNDQIETYEILGFVDDDKTLKNKKINGYPVLGNISWMISQNYQNLEVVIAVGEPKSREKIIKKICKHNFQFAKIIPPSAKIAKSASIGKGVIIQHNCIISADVKIKNYVYVNYNSTIGHDCEILDNVTISPGVNISGNNIIGNNTYIGTGTATKEKIRIGDNCFIGGGTIVGKNIPNNSIYFGQSGKCKNIKN